MFFLLKKLLWIFTFNSCLFLLLVIGIQNSSNKNKINFLIDYTVSLPVGFIVGSSFICGSLLGSVLTNNFQNKKL